MSVSKLSLGQAIDQTLSALSALEKKEQQALISTVCALLELAPVAAAPLAATTNRSAPVGVEAPQSSLPRERERPSNGAPQLMDIRSLRAEKQPDSARQMACIVAYYLMELAPEDERKQTISTADIERYFKQAGFKLPTKLEQLLIDCKRSGYVEGVARGEYKLTRVGYNLVTHSMPKSSKAP